MIEYVTAINGLGKLSINNPGNIEKTKSGKPWNGELTCNEPRFACFNDMAHGYRAMFILIRNYIKDYKANTLTKIINRWAPPSENQTNNYISFVQQKTGIHPNTNIHVDDIDAIAKIVAAMSHMENGVAAKASDVTAGKELAKNRFGNYVKTGIGIAGVTAIGIALYLIFKNRFNNK